MTNTNIKTKINKNFIKIALTTLAVFGFVIVTFSTPSITDAKTSSPFRRVNSSHSTPRPKKVIKTTPNKSHKKTVVNVNKSTTSKSKISTPVKKTNPFVKTATTTKSQ